MDQVCLPNHLNRNNKIISHLPLKSHSMETFSMIARSMKHNQVSPNNKMICYRQV